MPFVTTPQRLSDRLRYSCTSECGASRGRPDARHSAKFLAGADNVKGRGVLNLAGPVRNREGESVDFVATCVISGFVAQQSKEWNDPGVSSDAGRDISVRQTLEAMLEYAPQCPGVCEDRGDLVR